MMNLLFGALVLIVLSSATLPISGDGKDANSETVFTMMNSKAVSNKNVHSVNLVKNLH